MITPTLGVMKFTILVDTSLVIITLYMYLMCLIYTQQPRIYDKDIKHFHYMNNLWPHPSIRTPVVFEFYNFVRDCLKYISTIHFVSSIYAQEY